MSRLAVMAAVLSVSSAMASVAMAAPQKTKTFEDWSIECQPMSSDQKIEKCVASQVLTPKDKKGHLLEFSVGYIGQNAEPMVIALLPLGISLEAGAAYSVDEQPQVMLTLKSCTDNGCLGVAKLSDVQFKALQGAKALVVGVVGGIEGKPQTVKIPLSVKGLKAALDSLKK